MTKAQELCRLQSPGTDEGHPSIPGHLGGPRLVYLLVLVLDKKQGEDGFQSHVMTCDVMPEFSKRFPSGVNPVLVLVLAAAPEPPQSPPHQPLHGSGVHPGSQAQGGLRKDRFSENSAAVGAEVQEP